MTYATLIEENLTAVTIEDDDEIIVIDFETLGGGSFGDLQECYGYGWCTSTDSGWEWLNWKPGDPPPLSLLARVGDKVPVFHSASFDVRVAREMGINFEYYHDTLIMGYCVNPNITPINRRGHKPSKYGLWAWGIRLGKPKMEIPAKWEEWVKSPRFKDELVPYAKNDAEVEYALYVYLRNILCKDPAALSHYQLIERPYIEVIIEMSSVGFYIDNDALDELTDECEERMDAALKKCREIVPYAPDGTLKRWKNRRPDQESDVPEFNKYLYEGYFEDKKGVWWHTYRLWVPFKATDAQIAWALKYYYDWEPEEFTETGRPKVSADILGRLDYPLVEPLLELAETEKMLSTYCHNFREMQDEYGYVTCNWNQAVTKTGRLSSSEPNLQNLPTRTELGGKFRRVIAAPPDYDLVGIDLSQIEYRVMAALQWLYYSEQGEVPDDAQKMVQSFINQFNAKTPEEKELWDIHTVMANLWGVARKVGKNISFGRMFGFGNKKAGKMIGCTEAEAKALVDQANAMNPSFKPFQKSVWSMYEDNGGIGHTFFGRRLVYVDMCLEKYKKYEQTLPSKEVVPASDVGWRKASAERQSFNARIQGTAADIIKYLTLCVIVRAWELGARLMASVHDELIFCCPEKNSDILCAYLNESFRRTDLLPMVPVEGEAKKGKTWYECK